MYKLINFIIQISYASYTSCLFIFYHPQFYRDCLVTYEKLIFYYFIIVNEFFCRFAPHQCLTFFTDHVWKQVLNLGVCRFHFEEELIDLKRFEYFNFQQIIQFDLSLHDAFIILLFHFDIHQFFLYIQLVSLFVFICGYLFIRYRSSLIFNLITRWLPLSIALSIWKKK